MRADKFPCQRGTEYNAFVNRYRPQLLEVDKNLNAHFRKQHGARGQTETDRFVTDLANAQSTVANTMGGDYCARNGMIFGEVMALSGAADLPAYELTDGMAAWISGLLPRMSHFNWQEPPTDEVRAHARGRLTAVNPIEEMVA